MEGKNWEERFDAEFSGQNQLTQAILGALEYRGFYDAGKYLDDSISERIAPILKSFIASEITKARIEVLEEVEREAEAAREVHVISVGLERLIKGILRTVRIRIINGQQQKVSSPKD